MSNVNYSIIIPTFNESLFIENCINSLLQNNKINESEIIIIDGGSTDGTVEIIKKLKNQHSNISYFHNPKKITPSSLNIGISKSIGKYIIRLDAHSVYLDNYLDRAIEILDNTDKKVMNVGGHIITKSKSKNLVSLTIAAVLASIFGVGNSHFRTKIPEKEMYVDTVPFGCFKKKIFDELGLFNEKEHRNEDLEFNNRIILAGYKILLSPRLKSIYFSRDNIINFITQAFDNGYIVTNRIRKQRFHNFRHYVPLFFTIFLIFQLFVAFLNLNIHLTNSLNLVNLIYLFLNIFFSIQIAIKNRIVSMLFIAPITFLVLHISYGFGSICGFFNFLFQKNN